MHNKGKRKREREREREKERERKKEREREKKSLWLQIFSAFSKIKGSASFDKSFKVVLTFLLSYFFLSPPNQKTLNMSLDSSK